MPWEIERKFLVRNDAWRASVIRTEYLRDGLVAIGNGHKVRVRSNGDRSTLTVKTTGSSVRRKEFEYEIPLKDAEELLANHCGAYRLDKTRNHLIQHGQAWVVDEYKGILSGTLIAEIELDHEAAEFSIPDWIGEEVTLNPAFRKLAMLKSALERLGMWTPADDQSASTCSTHTFDRESALARSPCCAPGEADQQAVSQPPGKETD